ncbi:unnamed protein product [Staurois parvus]|uniref:Uncharacterized protein n=1 Tax=Staurois parvus TaxID=386267 RepID=A0ABN9C4X2_9NEOB|nr:unnamed protein product [Staurois parvus]
MHIKLSMCRMATGSVCLNRRRGEAEKTGSNGLYVMQRINPLGSTMSIMSMLYYIYRLILLLWV